MTIGLTFDEYVDLKLMPPKQADRAFRFAAEQMRDRKFPMTLTDAAWHVRTRGYDCRPQSLELLVKQQVIEPVDADRWTREDVDAVCDHFEQNGLYVPYAEMCRCLGCSYASFLRALKDAAERESEKYSIHVRADDQLFVMHRVPPRDDRDAIITFSLCDCGRKNDRRQSHPDQRGSYQSWQIANVKTYFEPESSRFGFTNFVNLRVQG